MSTKPHSSGHAGNEEVVDLSPHSGDEQARQIRTLRQSLADRIDTLCGRLLTIIRSGARWAMPVEDVTAELAALSEDLKRCYRRVREVDERTDLDYDDTTAMKRLDNYCIWLFHKIHLERLFVQKFALEAKLRGLVSADAFRVYEALLEAEDEEHRLLTSGADKIREQLLTNDC
jgi:hypothetical protein